MSNTIPSNDNMEEFLNILNEMKDNVYELNGDITNEFETTREEICQSIDTLNNTLKEFLEFLKQSN